MPAVTVDDITILPRVPLPDPVVARQRAVHALTTALAAFTFRLEPVVDTMDAVAIELRAMAWRESLG